MRKYMKWRKEIWGEKVGEEVRSAMYRSAVEGFLGSRSRTRSSGEEQGEVKEFRLRLRLREVERGFWD